MGLAIREALKGSYKTFPNPRVGAVVVANGKVVSKGYHKSFGAPHAESVAINKVKGDIENATLYVTLEPCPMCAMAISFARIRRLYFGAADIKGGGVENGPRIFDKSTCHHRPDVYGGIGEFDAAALLKSFFASRR